MSHLLISQKQRDQICVMLDSLKPEFGAVGSRDIEVRMRRDDVDLIISTLAALTKLAIPALKLPDTPPNALVALCEQMYDHRSTGATVAHDVWQVCIEELLMDAPHTAPIEPICATGGAEWVKVPREPTRQMMSQGHFAMAGTDRGKFRRIYQAMIAAAPQPE